MPFSQLTACVVCKDSRSIQLAELLAQKIYNVYRIYEVSEYEFWQGGKQEGTPDQLPSSVDFVFLHQEDFKLMKEIKGDSGLVFKFTSSGVPSVENNKNELPIYRKVLPNNLNIQLKDIDEIIAYLNQEQSHKPAICFLHSNIAEWHSLVDDSEYANVRRRYDILNHLLCGILLKNPKEASEYYNLYRFLGSPKPIIYVLDDYNRYITQKNGVYKVETSIFDNIKKYYRLHPEISSQEHFLEVLRGLCLVLNNLSLSFNVKIHRLKLDTPENDAKFEQIKPTYDLIYQTLNLDDTDDDNVDEKLSHNSDQIAAFIIDLEWLPDLTDEQTNQQTDEEWWKEWKKMGVKAIDILSERYPEIPCFIFTGSHPANELQEALVHRAYWGFQKPESHHYITEQAKKENQSHSELLNCLTIEQHLVKAVNRLYGSYQEVPFQQLNVNPNSSLWKELSKRLNIKLNFKSTLDECVRGRAFKKLISGLFPTATQVEPIKILSAGKSKASATFFVSPISLNNDRLATRFIKVGPWFLIQKEYLAYQKVIQPRLNSYTANIFQRPILTEVEQNQMPWGALMYTLAGFPEDYHNLQSLNDIFTQYKNRADGATFLVKCVRDTLDKVLFPLYQSSVSKSPEIQPLWCWLGDVMPSFYTGRLIPLIELDSIDCLDENTKSSDIFVIPSAIIPLWQIYLYLFYLMVKLDYYSFTKSVFYKLICSVTADISENGINEEYWKSALANLKELNKKLKSSKKNKDRQENKILKVLLSGWNLIYIDVPDDDKKNEGNITLVHPILGMRVYLHGSAEDIRLRFGATWIRPGMKVNVLVYLDTKEQRLNNINQNLSGFDKFNDNGKSGIDLKLIRNFKEANEITELSIPSPVDVFGDEFCQPDNYISILGHAAPIHGDLNLNNILYAANETVGWLIDFERVKEKGLVAYDLAKLEGEIWMEHLLHYIKDLANLSPAKLVENCYKLLYFCLQSSEFSGDEVEFFKTKIKSEKGFPLISDGLLIPITNLLKVIKSIRDFGFSKCRLSKQELKWSLSAYFLNAARLHFPPRSDNERSYITVMAFLVSAWHLSVVAPQSKTASENEKKP